VLPPERTDEPPADGRPAPLDLLRIEPPTPAEQLVLVLRQATPRTVAAGAAGAVVLAALAWLLLRPATPPTEDLLPIAAPTTVAGASATTAVPTTGTARAILLAHAAGAVQAPGLYQLPPGARVADLLQAAGGPAIDADLDRVNLAEPVADGSRVYVPRIGEEDVPDPLGPTGGGGAPTSVAGSEQPAAPLDLNTATAEELDTLPGVGPTTAAAILEHRSTNGPFASVDELLDVTGIGEAKLEQLRPLVTV
jgi:competence protein ComEA